VGVDGRPFLVRISRLLERSMRPKSLINSKTFWINALTLVITAGGALSGVIPPEYQAFVAGGLAIANIILRTITNQPINSAF
jgi:hypothetical protein